MNSSWQNNIDKAIMESFDFLDSDIQEQYSLFSLKRTLYIGKISSIIILLVLPYFIYQDIFILNLPNLAPMIRMVPISFAALFLLLSTFTPPRYHRIIKNVYYLLLFSLMSMMCYLTFYVMNTVYYETFFTGIMALIFLIFLGYRGKTSILFFIYVVPFVSLFIATIAYCNPELEKLVIFSTPAAVIIASCILSEIQSQLIYGEFRSKKVIELHNHQLQGKNDIIKLQNEELQIKKAIIEEKNLIIEKELKLAEKLQKSILPMGTPDMEGVSFALRYMSMTEVGGDFYEFIEMEDSNQIGIFISDVCGHGVPAALITSMLKTLLNTAGNKKYQVSSLLSYINESIIGQTGEYFLTAFYSIYDSQTKILRFARGGHNIPVLIRDGNIIELVSSGKFIGVIEGMEYIENQMQLQRGDKILFYTDGLVEARSEKGEVFENVLFTSLLLQSLDKNIEDLIQLIYDELLLFTGRKQLDDDMCIIGMEIE